MKGFLVLLVLAAGGLAGVYYFRQYIQARRAPVVAAAPAKPGKERHRRNRRGARRLARNEVFVASAPSGEGPAADAPPSKEPPGQAPIGEAPPPVFDRQSDERAPLAPGGAATTEVAPSVDVLGASAPARAPAPASAARAPLEEPPPLKLRAADLKMVWQGEDLSRTETQRLDFSSADGHELTENEIDARFRTKEDAVLGCVSRARPDDYTFIPGRINVRFRILRTGAVKGVQVEAPAVLQRGGLTGCIKGVVGSLRFPASSMGQVITFPFSLM